MGGIIKEVPVSQNPLVKKCGQVKRETNGPLHLYHVQDLRGKDCRMEMLWMGWA